MVDSFELEKVCPAKEGPGLGLSFASAPKVPVWVISPLWVTNASSPGWVHLPVALGEHGCSGSSPAAASFSLRGAPRRFLELGVPPRPQHYC
jgi:hypothetical protein